MKKKVLHVFADPSFGLWILKSLADLQANEGYIVEFATSQGEYLSQLTDLGYKVHVINFSRSIISFRYFTSFISLISLLKKEQYTIIHTHTPTVSFVTRFATLFYKKPIVINHMRTTWLDSPNMLLRAVFTRIERILRLLTDHVFTINCLDSRDLISKCNYLPKDVTCLHCGSIGLNTSRYDYRKYFENEKIDFRKELGFGKDDFVIGFIGRVVKEKGIIDLIDVFGKLSSNYPAIKLLIVGGVLKSERDKNTYNLIFDRVRNSNFSNKVVFTGFQNDVPRMLACIDLLILPSYREGFGMVIAEAMAMNVPVISSRTRGGVEAVIDGETGLLFEIGNQDQMANAIERLLNDSEFRNKIIMNANNYCMNFFDQKIVFNKMNEIYTSLIETIPIRPRIF